MTTLTEDLNLPAGLNPRAVTWTLFVAGEKGEPYPAAYGPNHTLVGEATGHPKSDGSLLIDNVIPTSSIDPEGTRYGLVLTDTAHIIDSTPRYLLVPDSPTPVTVKSCLSDPPGVILDPDQATELSDRLVYLEALLGTGFESGGNPSDTGDTLISGGTP